MIEIHVQDESKPDKPTIIFQIDGDAHLLNTGSKKVELTTSEGTLSITFPKDTNVVISVREIFSH